MDAGWHFHNQNVQIFKSQSLGVGSYGAVYRARCDQLPCAAKLLHPILADPKAPRNQQRFVQECQFLSEIRHPHIVQYLGTCRDPETGLPVLLMELMDNNLTHFLEGSKDRLPYHLEINFCHDIALALAYLHSNDIIHRDLSSNNVLLIAGSRAKVTDFGMSKLIDTNPRITPLTQCPGTTAYMAPEAVTKTPMYTNKLDCFAHGVLAIQIMTREFPNPSQATQLVDDPRSPTGTTLMPVLEPKRRKSHINRIHPHHPLLPIAIQCLGYNERARPSAQQLCNHLAVLKDAPQYIQSLRHPQGMVIGQQVSQYRDGRIAELQEQLQEKDAAAVTSQREIQRLTQDNQKLIQDAQQLRHELDQTIRDNQQLRREVRESDKQIEGWERKLQVNEETLVQKDKRVGDLEVTISARERMVQQPKLKPPSPPPQSKPKPPPPLQQKSKSPLSPPRRKPPSPPPQARPKPPSSPPSLPSDPKPRKHQKRSEASNTAVDTIKLNWRQCTKAPCGMFRGSATVDGSMAYFRPGGSSTVHAYDSYKELWSQLPECPQSAFTLAVVKGLLTAVGGRQSGKLTNTLLSLTGEGSKRKWSKHFPPMPIRRYFTAVVCSKRSLVVAGGYVYNTILGTVEVMDTESLQWFTASSLPHPLTLASATICGEKLYLLGGLGQSLDPTKAVFTCSLSALLKSCRPQSLGARLKRSLSVAQELTIWHTVIDIPVALSTCTTLCGQLIAVGGCDSDYNPTTAIRKYDSVKNTWTIINHLPTPQHRSLVAVLPGDRLMVVGGLTTRYYESESDIAQIATIL